MGIETALLASAIIGGIGTGAQVEGGRQTKRLAGQEVNRTKAHAANIKVQQEDTLKADQATQHAKDSLVRQRQEASAAHGQRSMATANRNMARNPIYGRKTILGG